VSWGKFLTFLDVGDLLDVVKISGAGLHCHNFSGQILGVPDRGIFGHHHTAGAPVRVGKRHALDRSSVMVTPPITRPSGHNASQPVRVEASRFLPT